MTTATKEKKGFVHHVYFWMKNADDLAAKDRLKAGLNELVKIDAIKAYHLGVPANTPREVVDNSYAFSLLLFFENKADQDIYQQHPDHLKFIEECQDTWERVQVYDSIDM